MISAGYMLRIRWDDPEWVQMHVPGGMVFDWARHNTINAARHARGMVKNRSGRLRSTVRADTRTGGPLSIRSYVRAGGARAPYARYVLQGTTGPIFARDWVDENGEMRPGFLRLQDSPSRGYPDPMYRVAVRGQKANNFLLRGTLVEIRAISAGARSRG